MKKWFTRKRIVILIVIIIGVLQFIPIDKNNSDLPLNSDLFSHVEASEEIKGLILRGCYDCHSENTNYPGYASVAPVSMWVEWHIEEGKEHLNFSNWSNYSEDKRRHLLEECVEVLEEKEMPMNVYRWVHSEADFSESEYSSLIQFFQDLQD
jgi:hypothetical protein